MKTHRTEVYIPWLPIGLNLQPILYLICDIYGFRCQFNFARAHQQDFIFK